MFFEQLQRLCKQCDTSPSAVIKKMGMSVSNVTNWKRGAVPSSDIVKKFADYFGVTIDYMYGEKKTVFVENITDGSLKFALFGESDNIPDAMLDEVKRFAKFIKNEIMPK